MGRCLLILLFSVLIASWPTASGAVPIFLGLGVPAGGDSSAQDASIDGTVVVGQMYTADGSYQAHRWENGVLEGLGWLPGAGSDRRGSARAVSDDGSVVVGSASSAAAQHEAFRWENGVMAGLGFLGLGGSGLRSDATDVSADGSVIVGTSTSPDGERAFRWENGSMTSLGILEGDLVSQAWGVSADGEVAVGLSSGLGSGQAFRWENGVMTGLGYLGTGTYSTAFGISADGLAIVGASSSTPTSSLEAFLYMDGTMTGLGWLDGDLGSEAHAASDNGEFVVGFSDGFDDTTAVIWDAANGMQRLQDVLVDVYGLGSQLAGWHLRGASWISPDGTIIAGYGINPDGIDEGFIAFVPEPSTVLLMGLAVAVFTLASRRNQPRHSLEIQ